MNIKLEKGIFTTPLVHNGLEALHRELRLTFETSPYGSRQEWGMNDFPAWDRKEFVARSCEAPRFYTLRRYLEIW